MQGAKEGLQVLEPLLVWAEKDELQHVVLGYGSQSFPTPQDGAFLCEVDFPELPPSECDGLESIRVLKAGVNSGACLRQELQKLICGRLTWSSAYIRALNLD
jgi:hypothetical protein